MLVLTLYGVHPPWFLPFVVFGMRAAPNFKVEAIRPVPDADFTKLFVPFGVRDPVHANKNLDKKGSSNEKKS